MARELRVLWIEDDEKSVVAFVDMANEKGSAVLAGLGFEHKPSFEVAASQEQADNMAREGQFDIVLLDLDYPAPATPVTSGGVSVGRDALLPGLRWLPELRRLQPSAAIVIMTKYAETDNVIAALQGGANNFVRKTDSFERKALCIQTAWRHAQALRNAERGREEFWDMLRSEASRIYADDLAAALNVTRLQLGRIARQIESGDVSATETAPEKIRKAFADLWRNYEQIASSIPGATEKPDNIDVVEQIVRPLTEIYPGPVTITEEPKEPLFLRIYRSDVKFTLHELVRNALEYGGGQVEIRVRSLTDGSAAEILILNPGEIDEKVCTGMFDRGVTSRPEDPRHIGMGLYLARRMMRSTGGEVELADPQPDRPGWVGMTVRIKSQGGQ